MRTYASSETVSPAAGSERVVYVDAGDTLWSLAESVKKDSMDTRHAVRLLAERNQLGSSPLHSGQMLIVPAELLP